MSNDLITSFEMTKDCSQNAKTIYAICRSITPQFYSKQSTAEMKAQCVSIMALIKNIRPDILSKMVELAISSYKLAHNSKIFFDINYILSFYNQAWDASRPYGFNWFVGVESNVVYLWARLVDMDENGKLRPDSLIWRDERDLR